MAAVAASALMGNSKHRGTALSRCLQHGTHGASVLCYGPVPSRLTTWNTGGARLQWDKNLGVDFVCLRNQRCAAKPLAEQLSRGGTSLCCIDSAIILLSTTDMSLPKPHLCAELRSRLKRVSQVCA